MEVWRTGVVDSTVRDHVRKRRPQILAEAAVRWVGVCAPDP